jgi:hypothetical protein
VAPDDPYSAERAGKSNKHPASATTPSGAENIGHWTELDRGEVFAVKEQPAQFIELPDFA